MTTDDTAIFQQQVAPTSMTSVKGMSGNHRLQNTHISRSCILLKQHVCMTIVARQDMLHQYAVTMTTRTWHLELLNRMAHRLAFLQGFGGLLCLSWLHSSRLLCRRLLYVWQRCRHLPTQCCMPFALCPLPGTYPTAGHRCSKHNWVRHKWHWL